MFPIRTPAVCPDMLSEDFTSNPHLVHQSIKISPNNICLFSKMYLFETYFEVVRNKDIHEQFSAPFDILLEAPWMTILKW